MGNKFIHWKKNFSNEKHNKKGEKFPITNKGGGRGGR